MGGSYETKLPNGIRMHESGGEVHLHDDAAKPDKLKVAVPVPVFQDKLAQLDDPNTAQVTIEDNSRNTVATLEKVGNDVKVSIEKKKKEQGLVGQTWSAIKDFSKKV